MSATSSLTKSCFAFVPRRGERDCGELDGPECFEDCADEAGGASAAARSDAFDRTWAIAERLCLGFQEDMYSSIFADMIAYLNNCGHLQEEDCIPTAALVTGVNMPDHGGVFGSLVARLRAQVSRHVAQLEPAACHSLSAAVATMVRQLSSDQLYYHPQAESAEAAVLEEEEDEEEALAAEPERRRERLPTTLPGLLSQYESTLSKDTGAGSPPKRARRDAAARPPLVVVWRDLEAFQPKVLQDLVLICSQYRRRLPIVFVFGISTCASEVHRLLPQHVSARLSLRKFHSQLATHYLTSIIDKVVLSSEMPFRLGGRALRLLLDIFLYNDFSVNNFISAYKYCMLHHFLSAPASQLCCGPMEMCETVEELTPEQLTPLRGLPSVKAALSAEEIRDDGAFRGWLVGAALALHTRHDGLLLALRCLWTLIARLPGAPLGKQFRELYNTALLHPLGEREEYVQCIRLLGMLSRDELVVSLEAALRVTEDLAPGSELTQCLQRHLQRARVLDGRPVPETAEGADRHRDHVQKHLKRATSRAELKQSLQTMGAAQSRRQNPFESFRTEAMAELDSRIRELTSRPSTWPLHEAVVFDSVSAVRRQLVGAPRVALQTALSDPARYLECDCCELADPKSVPATMPDVCIVYKLHLECGKLINMYDWLQAFKAVVDGDDDDETMQARFAQAVAQLQYLGFIRSTQRKTDHVARLTWGSC